MTHQELFESDLNEAEIYKVAESYTEEVPVPITRSGFEALLLYATAKFDIPLDDSARVTLAGFIHHIPRETAVTTIGAVAAALRKQLSNELTTLIYEEIDQKRRAEREAKTPKLVPDSLEAPTSNETSA